MTSAIARLRYVHSLLVALILLAACRYSTPFAPVRAVDLVHEFDRADKRPTAGFSVSEREVDGVRRPVIVAPVPSRLTLALPLPRRGVLHARAALDPTGPPGAAVRIRVGVSDDRIYEGLTEHVLSSAGGAWTEVRTDLSSYAGWKWSLFYRPDRITWRVVLAVDALVNGPATVLWAEPEILTDTRSAREYVARRQQLR
jgi:hypothetical protein